MDFILWQAAFALRKARPREAQSSGPRPNPVATAITRPCEGQLAVKLPLYVNFRADSTYKVPKSTTGPPKYSTY
jgi:hypothetical protein